MTKREEIEREYAAAKSAIEKLRDDEINGTIRRGQYRRFGKLANKMQQCMDKLFCSHTWNRTSPELRSIFLYAYKNTRGLRGIEREHAILAKIGVITVHEYKLSAVAMVLVKHGPKMCNSLLESK